MSATTIDWDEDLVISEEESYLSLQNALKRNQGFGLYFVRSLPFQTQHIINSIKRDLPHKKISVLQLTDEVDNLFNLIINFPDYQNLDVLFISGLEYSLLRYEEREGFGLTESSRSAVYGGTWAGVPPILGHLNLSRERFREHFPFSIVFCLPEFALRYFIRRAPDFFDWRSGVYEFPKERKAANSEQIRSVYKNKMKTNSKNKMKTSSINFLVRFLWLFSGANTRVLMQCEVDHDMYAAIGFFVLVSAILASLSGGYAFWTIFNSAKSATLFGVFWGLIVGNLNRFLVSTMRKEDHPSVQRIPYIYFVLLLRIFASFSIAFVITKPLEVKIFEKPIRATLVEQNSMSSAENQERLIRQYPEIRELKNTNQALEQELNRLQQRRDRLNEEVICELDPACRSNKVGAGPILHEKQKMLNLASQEYEEKKRDSEKQIHDNRQRIDELTKKLDIELNRIVSERAKANDIMTQLEILDHLSKEKPIYWWSSFLITLIFVLIDVTPILAKLFLKSSVYDIALRQGEEIAIKNALLKLRKEEEIAVQNALLKIESDSHKAWYNRGNALAELGRLEEASASYDNALRIKPDDYKVWTDRGIALLNLGKNEEAISSFDNALKLKPDLHEAWYYRGILLLNLGKNEEAISSFDNALKFKPDDADTYYNKACTYALQKNISLALENLKQAINLDSKYLEKAKANTDFNKISGDRRFIDLINQSDSS